MKMLFLSISNSYSFIHDVFKQYLFARTDQAKMAFKFTRNKDRHKCEIQISVKCTYDKELTSLDIWRAAWYASFFCSFSLDTTYSGSARNKNEVKVFHIICILNVRLHASSFAFPSCHLTQMISFAWVCRVSTMKKRKL